MTPGGHLMKDINLQLRTSMLKQDKFKESHIQTTEKQDKDNNDK